MQIISGSDIFSQCLSASVATIGNFDGVHRGHAEIFSHLIRQARRFALPSLVVTFEPHPLAVLAPELAPPRISTFEQKKALIAAAGVDYLAVIEFTRQFAALSADSFVREILCGAFGLRHIIIGHDYAFGRDRQGNFATLARLGEECGFTLEDLDPIGSEGTIYSSSLARRLIAEGDLPGASRVLGRYHVISGRVVHGREIGKQLGFPTANLSTANALLPPDGVYAVMVAVGTTLYQGACNIGTNPTFDGRERTVEVFLLDFDAQLYDQELAVCFIQRLRDVQKFPDAVALVDAIARDVASTREILAGIDRELVQPLLPPTPRTESA